MSQSKIRLDQLILERKLVESRNIAQSLIIQGLVLVENEPVTKPGALVASDSEVRLKQNCLKFVSRAGDKLDYALEHFRINVLDAIALDVGASTGGFTDCLLQRGASFVYAVDVGQNQLSYKIRANPKVKSLEKTHALNLSPEMFEKKPTIAVIDVSFISLRKIIENIISVLDSSFQLVVLVKPQFELEKEYVAKGGVVKSEKDQLLAVELVKEFFANLGLAFNGMVKSPVLGAKKGNQEYLLVFSRNS